jgi:hypothetical protein
MNLIITSMYDALLKEGSPEKMAREAAKEFAEIGERQSSVEASLGKIDIKLVMLQWMVGINLAMTAGIMISLLR